MNETALEMKGECEKCGGSLGAEDEAYICAFECTLRGCYAEAMAHLCPGRGGEPVRRPRRKSGR